MSPQGLILCVFCWVADAWVIEGVVLVGLIPWLVVDLGFWTYRLNVRISTYDVERSQGL